MKTSKYLRWSMVISLLLLLISAAHADEPVRHDFPTVGNYTVLTGDFHMHTVNSDGRLTTRERVEESYRMGYDVISITDHNTPKGYRIARNIGESLGMIVLRGLEVTLDTKEHINVFGISEDFDTVPLRKLAVTKADGKSFYMDEFKRVTDDGGIVVYNHPHMGYQPPVELAVSQSVLKGVEIKNQVVGKGWNTINSHGTYWYPEAFTWALKNNLAMFANSDAHSNRREPAPITLLFVTERSSQGVLEAIRDARTAAWFDGMLWGRESLLTDLVTASIKAVKTPDGITLQNQSPVILKGNVQGSSSEPFELGAYQTITVNAPDTKDTVSVSWNNVWIGLDKNLVTELKVAGK